MVERKRREKKDVIATNYDLYCSIYLQGLTMVEYVAKYLDNVP